MAKKLMSFKTKGMNRDLSVSAFNPEFSFENKNLRLQTNDGNTLLSWVNEKGTKKIPLVKKDGSYAELQGIPIGTAILDKSLILFTTGNTNEKHPLENIDYIYKFNFSDNKDYLCCTVLFQGNLNFHASYPIETIVSYETNVLQKVYWTDNRNQLRFINICNQYESNSDGSLYTRFDFIPVLKLNETVKVHKEFNVNGTFASGVIQYALTYYNKNGQESNIFYTSPLLYVSPRDRGARPDEKVEIGFQITVSNVDTNFEYLRIYSIQRTSINGTPICKRVRDVSLRGLDTNNTVSWIDTGNTGDSVDPTELLYKGGDTVIAKTIEQKDGTLFMGGIKLSRSSITDLSNSINKYSFAIPSCSQRNIAASEISTGAYYYANQLSAEGGAERHNGRSVPCGGFKTGNYYRLGVQFQHESGKWSEPLFLGDYKQTAAFDNYNSTTALPIFQSSLTSETGINALKNAGYKKMRPLVVFPQMKDRDVICQGVAAPTVYQENPSKIQSSWFFRPKGCGISINNTTVAPKDDEKLLYTDRNLGYNPASIRGVEIEGHYKEENKFTISRAYRTLHSPDIEFDEQMSLVDFSNKKYLQTGVAIFSSTMSDIDIQTETPTVSNVGSGFVHKSFVDGLHYGIVSGLFYDDFFVDDDVLGTEDNPGKMGAYPYPKQSAKWLIYPWQGTGSLNNDINRPADEGIASAKLKKKVISNLRYSYTGLYKGEVYNTPSYTFNKDKVIPQIFNSEENTILKYGGDGLYRGNIDTVLSPDDYDGKYFAWDENLWWGALIPGTESKWHSDNKETPFESTTWWKTWNEKSNDADGNSLRKWNGSIWKYSSTVGDDIGEKYVDLVVKKLQVRMKYKSTPHLFAYFDSLTENPNQLAIVDVTQTVNTRYGGSSVDALRENIWLPCGEPVNLDEPIYWDYGDTYFQRYDCLKTYPYTTEDLNQIVEIGSFMLETYVNIDGRYDRNRGQVSNLNMSPKNFNLMNPVYSQQDNFFSYRILPDDYYTNSTYPNQLTWSKTKENGAEIDLWTNVTLASILELDGDKGTINKLVRFNNQLLCFQDTGISQILYNENAQIATTEGVPIELANSGKVQGKRYINNTIGCSNKWSISQTPNGIYFIDSNDKSIYLFNGNLSNISQTFGFNSWCKMNIKTKAKKWDSKDFDDFTSVYDKANQEVLFINKETALAFSEKMQTFTSFYDYGNTPFLCNLEDVGIWIKGDNITSLNLWRHQGGEYCSFFGEYKPYGITLVGNPEPQTDKIFTNLEFRACVTGDASFDTFDETFDYTFHSTSGLNFYLPFDYLETWNEYQHGYTTLENKNGHAAMVHGTDSSALKRKFRIWRCDIPRDNYTLLSYPDRETGETDEDYQKRIDAYTTWINGEKEKGITRASRHPQDRMRNPWLYLKLQKSYDVSNRCEIHDFIMTYFN